MVDKDLKIKLLELQIEALRSVLSEWDADKNCYTQMIIADAIACMLECL